MYAKWIEEDQRYAFAFEDNGGVEISDDEHAALFLGQSEGRRIVAGADGRPALVDPSPPAFADLVAMNVAAIQTELDRRAKMKGYDNIVSACSYAAQAEGDLFQAEGQAFLRWRSQVWAQAYAFLAEVQAGTRTLPTPEGAVAAMPALELP